MDRDSWLKFSTERSISGVKLFLCLMLIALPWLILVISSFSTDHFFTLSVPIWSDELSYWHEVLSLSQKGLNHGYYTYNEVIPTVSTFGPHGFGTVSVYALFAKVFGWKTYSIVFANTFFMSLAFLFLILMLKPTTRQILFILLLAFSFSAYLLFSLTSMSEGLNYALLIVYFTLLYKFIQVGNKKLLFTLLAVCTAFSFIRIIYIVLFLPFLFIQKNECKFNYKLLINITLWVVFSSVLFLFICLFVSPYTDSFLYEFFHVSGFVGKISFFVVHFIHNSFNFINPLSDNIIQVLERYFFLIILIYSLIKSDILQSKLKKMEIKYFVVFLILFSVLLITFSAYDVFDWRDYRVLSPILYGCVLFLILNMNRFEIYVSLVINVLMLLFLIASPQVWNSFNENRYSKPTDISVLKHIKFSPNVKTCFENTLVIQSFNQNFVLNVPAGIGISTVDSLSDKLQSKYIFSENELKLKTFILIDSDKFGYLYSKMSDNRTKSQD